MTEEQVKRGLNMIRFTGILVTILFFVAAIVLALVFNSLNAGTNVSPLSQLLPWIIGLTVAIAVLFIVVYFVYGAVQRGRVKK
jgi:preprotein translocase subunit SecG